MTQTSAGTFGGQIIDYIDEHAQFTGTGTTGPLSLVKSGPATLTLTGDYPSATGSTNTTATE